MGNNDAAPGREAWQDGAGTAPTVEAAHEALIRRWPGLRGLLSADRAALHLRRQAFCGS